MSRIEETFRKLAPRRETALITYLTAGDPTIEQTESYASALIEGGADILELGIPFSDPIADGPIIQAASKRALRSGTTPKDVFECVYRIKMRHDIPVVILTYYNPLFRMGLESSVKKARMSGVDGIVVPDLPFDEADEFRGICLRQDVDPIFLATPTTSKPRLKRIFESSRGFVYLVSVMGVTGSRDSLPPDTLRLVDEVCRYADGSIPVAVGFGISKPDHIRKLRDQGADGAIVGSALVNIVSLSNRERASVEYGLRDTTRLFKTATQG